MYKFSCCLVVHVVVSGSLTEALTVHGRWISCVMDGGSAVQYSTSTGSAVAVQCQYRLGHWDHVSAKLKVKIISKSAARKRDVRELLRQLI